MSPLRVQKEATRKSAKRPAGSKVEAVFRLTFSGKDLKSLPPHHSAFVVVASLASHDLTAMNRTLLAAHNSVEGARKLGGTLAEYAYAQNRVIARIASAKVYEVLELIEQHRKRCERSKDSFGNTFHKRWSKRLAAAHSSAGFQTAEWLRNKFTNHYDLAQGREIVANVPDDQTPSIYLHKKEGNTGSFIGEEIAIIGGAAQRGDPIKILREWEDWVLETARLIAAFYSAFMSAMLEQFFPDKIAFEQRILVPKALRAELTTFSLPVFWDIPD